MEVFKACSINDVPDEILSRIFQEYVKTHDIQRYPPPSFVISYKARTCLCAISHRMREIALRTPQLWVYIQTPGYPPAYPPIPLLELWIERSGSSLPLSVDLYPGDLTCGHPGDIIDPEHEANVMQLLRPHLHRWRSLKVFLAEPTAAVFAKLPLETAEKLESLEAVYPFDQELNNKILANIAKLPALRHLDWDKYYDSEDEVSSFQIAITSFPWHQLRSITLSVMMSPNETLRVLSALTSAVVIDLKIRRGPSNVVDPVQHPLITLPELRCFEVRSDVGIYETLQHLDLPGLKAFRIFARRFQSDGPNISCARYKDFISRMSTSLEYLFLHTFDFAGDDYHDFFNNPKLLNPPNVQFAIHDDDTALEAVERGLRSGMQKRLDLMRTLTIFKSSWTPHEPHMVGWLREEHGGSEKVRMEMLLPRHYLDAATWDGR